MQIELLPWLEPAQTELLVSCCQSVFGFYLGQIEKSFLFTSHIVNIFLLNLEIYILNTPSTQKHCQY